jgi:hypothetical protein
MVAKKKESAARRARRQTGATLRQLTNITRWSMGFASEYETSQRRLSPEQKQVWREAIARLDRRRRLDALRHQTPHESINLTDKLNKFLRREGSSAQ